ncbi:MAG: hypothetical protein N2255_10135 [Kiritimatiellae bacterium]|nr:hypothetical protein [Kiritimatiellia bacterium]
MLETINNLILKVADPLFNWILYLPRDLALFAVAIITSAVLTFSRRWTTDQEWLARADRDQVRLKALLKEAKKNKRKADVARYKQTILQIKTRSLKYEVKPLLVALVPILLLATWCFARLGFHPPREGDVFELKLYVPSAGIGRLVHLVPENGIEAVNGWIRPVEPETPPVPKDWWEKANARAMAFLGMSPPLEAVAIWQLKAKASPTPYHLTMIYDGKPYRKEVLVGQRTYTTPMEVFGPESPVRGIETVFRPLKLFGVVPGIDMLFLPPWLVAYLLIAIPFVSIFKKLFKIY